MRLRLCTMGLTLLAGAALLTSRPALSGAQTLYSILDLGAAHPNETSYANDINNAGQVVGTAVGANSVYAFRYTDGVGLENLSPPSSYLSEAGAINDKGQVAGDYYSADGTPKLFRYTDGTGAETLGDLGYGGRIYDMNNRGQIVGSYDYYYDFRYTDGVGVEVALGGGAGRGYGTATGINDAGQVVGTGEYWDYKAHAFRYTDEAGLKFFGSLGGPIPGSYKSEANAINEAGDFGGGAATSTGRIHAFFYSDALGKMIDLGTLGGDAVAYGLNNENVVVGDYFVRSDNQPQRPFVDFGTGMFDLQSLLEGPAQSEWTLLSARAINDKGQIIGEGLIGGQKHAFRLTPNGIPDITVPEPGLLTLLACGGISGFGLALRRKRAF